MSKIHILLSLALLMGACQSKKKESFISKFSKMAKTLDKKMKDKIQLEDVPSEEWYVASFNDGDMGYQTEDEEVMLKGNYSFCRAFSDQHASVRNRDNRKMGIIDENGNEVIPFEYEYTSAYSNGFIAVRKDKKDKVGYIDLEGDVLVEPKYDMGFAFKGGRARIAVGHYQDYLNLKQYEKCKYGFIDEKGEEIIEAQYEWAGDFAEGIAPVSKNGRYFFIDQEGNRIDDKSYSNLSGFKRDLCWVQKGSKGGFINKDAEIVIPMEYSSYMYFFSRGSRYSASDKESELGETRFQTKDDLFFLQKGGKWGIINDQNEVLTPFEYGGIDLPNSAGYIKFEKNGKDGYGSYADGVIAEIVPAQFDYVFHYESNDLIIVGKGPYGKRKTGAYNLYGDLVVDLKYDEVKDIGNGFSSVQTGKKYGVCNAEGKQITGMIYDYVGSYSNGSIHVKKGSKYVYIDEQGKEVR